LEDDGEGIGSSDVGGGSSSGRIAGPGSDESKTIPGERRTVKATVEAIEKATRSLTLKGPEGNYVNVTVPEEVKRFDSLKVGDTITAIDPSAPSITFKGAERLDLQLAGAGPRRPEEGEGRRPRGHHVDRGVADLCRVTRCHKSP
jgi:hypothetical protein